MKRWFVVHKFPNGYCHSNLIDRGGYLSFERANQAAMTLTNGRPIAPNTVIVEIDLEEVAKALELEKGVG